MASTKEGYVYPCSLDSYLTYMKSQTKKMALHHTTTSLSVADKTSVNDYAPSDRKKRYKFIQDLNQGLVKQCVLCTYSIGGPVGNYHFVWQLPDKVSMEAALCENQKLIANIQSAAPTYHHRALRQHLIPLFENFS